MSGESVCRDARSWVEVGSVYNRLFVFMIFTFSVRNILEIPPYASRLRFSLTAINISDVHNQLL
jgi:hypothetical protein